MSNLSNILPEFARDRALVRRELSEKQTVMFERWADEQRQAELARIDKILSEANDLSPGTTLPTDTSPVNPDLSEMQRQLNLMGFVTDSTPSLDKRIRGAVPS